MDISNHASKFNEWKELYNWNTCKANRQGFGGFISHFLTSDSRVINLNGTYGSGKTEFIRRLYVELAQQKHPVVYIDVWESDFSKNPLSVICSELLHQIEFTLKTKAPNGKAIEKRSAKKLFNNLKSKLGICLKYLDAGVALSGDPLITASTKVASKIAAATPNIDTRTKSQAYVEIVQKNHVEAVQAVKDIKSYITYLSELIEIIYELNIPIVILIDELDRCRPTYAVEVLEVIKHFFETKGCTFLVATNTSVLEHSVKSIYGQDFDANLYLRRFFDRKISLPKVSTLDYLIARNFDFDKYKGSNILLYPFTENQMGNIGFFAALLENTNIELREIEQILNRFFTSLDYAKAYLTASDILINTVVLMVGLIEQHMEKPELGKRANRNNTPTSINTDGNDIIEYSLSNMVNYMFKCVTITKSKERHDGGGGYITYSTSQEMLGIQSGNFAQAKLLGDNHDSLNFFKELMGHCDDGNCNYWMWEDYQKIIELSGHIE